MGQTIGCLDITVNRNSFGFWSKINLIYIAIHIYTCSLHFTGLPDHSHGTFPNKDNPDALEEQDHVYVIPKNPVLADSVGCLPRGTIGAAINGIPFYNPYTPTGLNAVEGQ